MKKKIKQKVLEKSKKELQELERLHSLGENNFGCRWIYD